VVREQVRAFIVENLLMGEAPDRLDDADSLMELGILDSVGVLDLVGFIESTWHITVNDEELVRENLDSIENLVGFIERKVA
jgi:acyl carrier protein